MSDISPDRPSGLRAEVVVMVTVALLVLVALFYVVSGRKQVLRASPAGMDGLAVWLASEGIGAQSFSGGWPLDVDTIGLNVIPVYDSQIGRDRVAPRDKKELLLQQDEYDLYLDEIQEKIGRVPSLVVLPKWRSGMRLTGLGHPVLLVEQDRVTRTLRQVLGDNSAQIGYSRSPFTDFDVVDGADQTARIYAAQMFSSKTCTPLIGRDAAMLLARCPLSGDEDQDSVLVLSDPDLLNNHGLRLGDNAHIARDLLGGEADGKTVMIDYSPVSWLRTADQGVQRERTWADLLRFFDPPFLALWVGAGVILLLALWRAARRFGPVVVERLKIEASKAYAIRARARLMRLSDQDGALVGEYAKARIAAVAAQLVGPAEARRYGQRDTFLKFIARRYPKRASELEAALQALEALPARTTGAQAIGQVTALEQVLERITHDT